jgi:hypothetical protein
MAKLWFRNSNGQERFLTECETLQEVNIEIDKFIADANDRYPNKRAFKRYYTRMWQEDGRWKFDVGSHTEFFYWDSDKSYEEMSKENDTNN